MFPTLLLATTILCGAPGNVPDDSLRVLYERGQTYSEFLAAADSRRETWFKNSAYGQIGATLLARVKATGGGWRLLVVLEDSCGDSVNTIPYLASLVDSLRGAVEMRLVNSTEGRAQMERHRTWDDRVATPTVILLTPEWQEVGCWVERPASLSAWEKVEKKKLSQQEFLKQKYAWYDQDRGASAQRDIVEMIERAAPGAPCGGNAP